MPDLRETLAGDDYWANPVAFPSPEFLKEQQDSAFYHETIIRRYHALGQGAVKADIDSTHPWDLPPYAEGALFSLVVDTRVKASPEVLQGVASSLGDNALATSKPVFYSRVDAIMNRSGVTPGARWLDLSKGTLVERDRFYGLRSYVYDREDIDPRGLGYLIMRSGNEMQARRRGSQPPRPTGPRMVLPQSSHNVVIPNAVFEEVIEEINDPEMVIHRKIIRGFMVLPPPPRRTARVPGQRPSPQS